MRVFLDASVLFAAAYSASGASREIIRRGILGELSLVVSTLVVMEARRNLEAKAPGAVGDLEILLEAAAPQRVRPSEQEVRSAMRKVAAKDAPVLAAAVKAGADCLVSLDRKHLVGFPALEAASGISILLPGDLLEMLRG